MNQELLKKFLQNKCTPEEVQNILKWSKTVDDRQVINLLVQKGWYQVEPDRDIHYQKQLLKKITTRLSKDSAISRSKESRSFKFDPSYFSKVAATVLIFTSVVSLIFLTKVEPINDFSETPQPINWITKNTAWGEKLTFQLPDRTIVQLNSGSSIKYPDVFQNIRQVELKGEAYFQVESDSLKPFKVLSNEVETTALGTEFNVFARDITNVALVEGKVSVRHLQSKTVILQPNEVLIADISGFKVETFDASEILGWKYGKITFKNERIAQVLKKIERYYGVEVHTKGTINDIIKISGTFPNQNLENVIQGLSYTLDCKYQLIQEEKKVVLTKK